MKALPILLAVTLALTAVSLAPTSVAWCHKTQASPVLTGEVCSSGDCRYYVLEGRVAIVDCDDVPP